MRRHQSSKHDAPKSSTRVLRPPRARGLKLSNAGCLRPFDLDRHRFRSEPHEQVAALRTFRMSVGRLDSRCSVPDGDDANSATTKLLCDKWESVARGSDPPRAMGWLEDAGGARLFVAPSTAVRLLRKRPAKKSAARLPIASLRGASDSLPWILLVVGFLNISWAIVTLSETLAAIELVHMFKKRGRTRAISFHSMGLGWPSLS